MRDAVVTLNVGGVSFQTSMATLQARPDSWFGGLARGFDNCGFRERRDEVIFIDRDPQRFRHILNYLRGGSLHVSDPDALQEVVEEAEYFALDGLAQLARRRLSCAMADSKAQISVVDRASATICREIAALRQSTSHGQLSSPPAQQTPPRLRDPPASALVLTPSAFQDQDF